MNRDDQYDSAWTAYSQECRERFARFFKGDEGQSVDWVRYSPTTRVQAMSCRDALIESLDSFDCEELLTKALRESKCPHVAALKAALVNEWILSNAADVAQLRIEE
ncbi:MAG: hypothetical protein KGL39_35970 [Patescibacteria group bacterium]|nr:hypothetical protein [Patescibacteria group bacterium]